MKADKYSIKDFFVNRYLEQIIIPEIQRDYVWGVEQVTGLIKSIHDDFLNYQNKIPAIQAGNDSVYIDYYKRTFLTSNIGFIYAYNDEQYPDRYFLIDGQQRITTIFLLMLILAKRNDLLKDRFKRTFYNNEISKLDYKVRETSHDFLINFIPFALNETGKIKDQKWYYHEYEQDKTIQCIITNFTELNNYFDSVKLNEVEFYKYVEDYTELRYFDTNLSEQGEELYVYMNARGEQIQSHENLKADLLGRKNNSTSDEKNNNGILWEKWQDFFWLHKDKNENADIGFNEFLSCISGLENYLKMDKNFYTTEQFKKDGIRVIDLLNNIDIDVIKKYINCLIYIEREKDKFKSQYIYSDWVDKSLALIWEILNKKNNTNWYADYTDANRTTERSRMVYIWSILYYFSLKAENCITIEDLNIDQLFRVIRLFYIRYNNFNRSVSTIQKTVALISKNGVFDDIENQVSGDLDNDVNVLSPIISEETDGKFRTFEELKKAKFLNKFIDELNVQRDYEQLIWEIEDHKYNLDGRDVGNINISHIVNFDTDLSIDQLMLIKNKFNEIFPEAQRDYLELQSILLYYSNYWYTKTPSYYTNLGFFDWKYIIRSVDKNKNAFKVFFNEYLVFNGTVAQLLEHKRSKLIDAQDADSFRKKLLWYNQYIGEKMWAEGNYIAHSIGNYCGLPNWKDKDKVFEDIYILYNTKGDLRGYNQKKLYDLLPNDVKKQVKEAKQQQ